MPSPCNSPDRLEIKNRVKLCLGDTESIVEPALLRWFPGPFEIITPVIFVLENVPAVASPLDGVKANIGDDKFGVPWHGRDITSLRYRVN